MNAFTRNAVDPAHPKPNANARRHVALMLTAPEDQRLWRTALASQGISSIDGNLAPSLASALRDDVRLVAASAMIVDMPLIHAAGLSVERLAEWVRRGYPGLVLFVRMPWRVSISRGEQSWARRAGVAGLLPGESVADWGASLTPSLTRVLRHLGRSGTDVTRLSDTLRVLVARGEEPRPGPMKDAVALARRVEMLKVDPLLLLESMKAGVGSSDRRYHGAVYRQCFVASLAIDWLVAARKLPRQAALAVGEYLWMTGRIHHVVRERPFADDDLFFRFSGDEERLDRIDLHELQREMRGPQGIAISARSYLGKTYPRAFVGSEAVDWLMQRGGLSVGEAEAIGQRLLDIGAIHHVVDEHGFSDAAYYYRFRADES